MSQPLKDEDTIKRAYLPEPYIFLMKPFTDYDLKHAIEDVLKNTPPPFKIHPV